MDRDVLNDFREALADHEFTLELLATVYKGDVKACARSLQLERKQIEKWLRQKHREERQAEAEVARKEKSELRGAKRPYPPEVLFEESEDEDEQDNVGLLVPAPELDVFVRQTFLNPSSRLYNMHHDHLELARIGYLWSNVENSRQGNRVVGMAEKPFAKGDAWAKQRYYFQLMQWFGRVPHFVITLDAECANDYSDGQFCGLLEHELYHCAPKLDDEGEPMLNPFTNEPVFCMRGHDVEEFVGVVRRYGAGNAAGGTQALVNAAKGKPQIARVDIAAACGTCLRVSA